MNLLHGDCLEHLYVNEQANDLHQNNSMHVDAMKMHHNSAIEVI